MDAINAVLILTDGEDYQSQISLKLLSEKLKKSNFFSDDRIAFFTVGYGKEGEFNRENLKKVANLNGGYYSKVDLETISRQIDLLAMQYRCARIFKLPSQNQLPKRLESSNMLLSSEVQQQLLAVQTKLQLSSGVARHLNQLAKSLQHNIQLANLEHDTRMRG